MHRGLLAGDAGEMAQRRKEFAAEIAAAVEALNRLQEHYDRRQYQTSAD